MTLRNKWTSEQIRNGRKTPIKPLLEKMGYRLRELENGNMEVLDLSSPVIIKEHYWSCPQNRSGGNAVDLLIQVMGMSFNEAMGKLEESM